MLHSFLLFMRIHVPHPYTSINPMEGNSEENVRVSAIHMKKVVLPTCGLRNHMLKKHKTLKFGKKVVLKLKKVVMPNILSLHLTLIATCFCSLEMLSCSSSSILSYISITLALGRQIIHFFLGKKQNLLIFIKNIYNIPQFSL